MNNIDLLFECFLINKIIVINRVKQKLEIMELVNKRIQIQQRHQ